MTTSAQGTFAEAMAGANPEMAALARTLRAIIVQMHPEHVEICWPRQGIASYGVGPKKMSEHYAYIAPQKAYVNLGFYHGVNLPDPVGLLQGTGKKLRHIKIHSEAEARRPSVKALLAAALADRQAALRA